jgi:hypothetical protein
MLQEVFIKLIGEGEVLNVGWEGRYFLNEGIFPDNVGV